MAPRGGGSGSRSRLLAALFYGAVLGLALSLGSLHLQRVRREAAAAVELAQQQAQEASAMLAEQQSKADSAESARVNLQRRLTEMEEKLKATGGPSSGAAAGDRHTPWVPSEERDKKDPELAAVLRKVAINNEVLASMSNINYAMPGGMLDTWMENVQRAGVKNAMVIALDSQTKANAEAKGMTAHEMHIEIPKAQANNGDNHAVSALKFRMLRHFLQLGYSVLLSDVDIVTLQNPFDFLERDSDVEGMSDGFDNGTAYGYNDVLDDPTMGWARYAHSMRVFVFNSGLFYIRPTPAAMDLLDRLVQRVETENGWDQALFNEVIYFPSRPGYTDPLVKRRVLDYLLFMNSKVLFKTVRVDKARFADLKPVMIHVNYHPNKHERMLAIVDRYVKGVETALDSFPGGSDPGS